MRTRQRDLHPSFDFDAPEEAIAPPVEPKMPLPDASGRPTIGSPACDKPGLDGKGSVGALGVESEMVVTADAGGATAHSAPAPPRPKQSCSDFGVDLDRHLARHAELLEARNRAQLRLAADRNAKRDDTASLKDLARTQGDLSRCTFFWREQDPKAAAEGPPRG